ncbi:unnamed protein product [Prunus armeniaca]
MCFSRQLNIWGLLNVNKWEDFSWANASSEKCQEEADISPSSSSVFTESVLE